MKTLLSLKKLAENIPYPLGKLASHVPHAWRLGSTYSHFAEQIPVIERASPEVRLAYVIEKLDAIVQYAQKNIPFYQSLYGGEVIRIRSLADFESLPVITRSQVRAYTSQAKGAMLVNTGGTSGEPLSFYIDKKAWAREWAHMHYIWSLQQYRPTNLMFTMLGKNLHGRYDRYNAVHNEFRLNPYMDAGLNVDQVISLFERYPVKFLQGYPSSIYNFLREIEPYVDETFRKTVRSKIKCVFLSSEYPLPYMVSYISKTWGLNCLSWYGHSEMCVLAYESKAEQQYKPLMTYGFAEIHDQTLCGTSFNNYDMPLIRYVTGDKVVGHYAENGLLSGFAISDARTGDYIVDKHGRMITLTGLIFGRHHQVFNVADYVQVYQPKVGDAVIVVAIKESKSIGVMDLPAQFDLRDTDMNYSFIIGSRPVLTKAGKLKLLISPSDFEKAYGTTSGEG